MRRGHTTRLEFPAVCLPRIAVPPAARVAPVPQPALTPCVMLLLKRPAQRLGDQ